MANHETTVEIKIKDLYTKALRRFKNGLKDSDKALNKFNRGLDKTIQIGAKVGTSLAAVTTGLTALGVSSANAIRELQGFSNAAGISINDLRAYGSATQTAGISLDQFADISKDVNDKLGDFIATGGGGFKDFFERVPAAVRPSAEALAKLAAPDVLIAVKDAMDAANVSGKEQTFILESIGNDASKLAPLLANTGEELNGLADAFRKTNDELTEDDIASIKAFGEAVKSVGENAETTKHKLTSAFGFLGAEVANELNEIGDSFQWFIDSELGFKKKNEAIAAAQKFTAELNKTAGAGEDVVDSVEEIGKSANQIKIDKFADHMVRAANWAQSMTDAFKESGSVVNNIESDLERIKDLREGGDTRKPTVLGALTKSSQARRELDSGNAEKAASLALEAAQELRDVEEETGKAVTNSNAFIKNFEEIAEKALAQAEEKEEQLKLVIEIAGQAKEYDFTKQGIDKAGRDASDALDNSDKRGAQT